MEEEKQPKDRSHEEGRKTTPNHKLWSVAGIVMLSFVASFLGAWVFLATGLVQPDVSRTISENRESIVLQESEVIAEVFKKVSPSTVAVIGHPDGSAPSSFFAPASQDRPGSGVIISKDGYVMTNKHVIPEGVNRATVILHDGTEYTDVDIVGRDPFNDIAFLKINGVNDLTPAKIGDSSQLTPGQKVVAIGNALGEYRNSVSSGIISGIGRPVEAVDGSTGSAERLENLLQTDAAINPGNSGGPLVNLSGEVIGINTATSEQGEAISFAIPINDTKGLIKSVLNEGKVAKAYLGVRYVTLTSDVAKELDLPTAKGSLLLGGGGEPAVMPGGPADKAGLQENDIVTKVNSKELAEGASLASELSQFAPGDKITLTILRDKQEQTLEVTLGEYPA